MKTVQLIKTNMYRSSIDFCNLNDTIVQKIPMFAANLQFLKKNLDEIQLFGKLQGTDKTGLAIDKNKLKEKLITLATKYSNKVAIFAKGNSNDTLLQEIRFSVSDLEKLPGEKLVETVQIIHDRIEANIAALADQGITADTQKTFLESIVSFNKSLANPRIGIVEKRQATQKLQALFAAADAAIEIMDLAAASAKDEFPDFYNGYRTARKLVDISSGSLALKASAKELPGGEPLPGAVFTFKQENSMAGNGNGLIVKKTSKKGNFNLKSIDPGTYKVQVSKDGYKGQEVSVNVTEGERSELIVEMEKA
jgi:hypothetical protein